MVRRVYHDSQKDQRRPTWTEARFVPPQVEDVSAHVSGHGRNQSGTMSPGLVSLLQKEHRRLEQVQRIASKMDEGQGEKFQGQQLCYSDLFSLKK